MDVDNEYYTKNGAINTATSEGSGEELEMQHVGGSYHSPSQSLELPGCFTGTKPVS